MRSKAPNVFPISALIIIFPSAFNVNVAEEVGAVEIELLTVISPLGAVLPF